MPPAILGREASLDQCLTPPPDEAAQNVKDWFTAAAGLRDEYETNAEAREVIETARGLEGLRRQDSIHAAAVVISPMPLQEIVPVQQQRRRG